MTAPDTLEAPEKEFEIIFNGWFVHDRNGIIYNLYIRPYLGIGSDEEKVMFLQTYAQFDFLVAREFPIPDRFQISLDGESDEEIPSVSSMRMFKETSDTRELFEDAMAETGACLPDLADLSVNEDALILVTPLFIDDNGHIVPADNIDRV